MVTITLSLSSRLTRLTPSKRACSTSHPPSTGTVVRTRTAVPGIEQEDKKEDSLGLNKKIKKRIPLDMTKEMIKMILLDMMKGAMPHVRKDQLVRNKRGCRTIIVMSMRNRMFPLKYVGDGELLRPPMNRAAMVAA